MGQKIRKLPQDLVNKIAAGEVVERPASVVKELVDNSIDAGATQVKIRIDGGGLKLIEISDNGYGIEKDEIVTAFEPHATSKISSMNDLNSIMTMGFRGEALSTIVSVSDLKIITKTPDTKSAYETVFKDGKSTRVEESARETGTTISVQNLFSNIPARLKYMKTPETEYKKIFEMLTNYFIQFPQIHFILFKEGMEIINFPEDNSSETLSLERIRTLFSKEWTEEPIILKSSENSLEIDAVLAHPKFHSPRYTENLVFVNGRPIVDRALIKAVITGYHRFIPINEKVPFVLSLKIDPSNIDVNVHPRKEEVRFENPYRVFESIEKAVSKKLSELVKEKVIDLSREIEKDSNSPWQVYKSEDNAYNRLRDSSTKIDSSYSRSRVGDIGNNISGHGTFVHQDSLFDSTSNIDQNIPKSESSPASNENLTQIFQVFNKYIVVEIDDTLWLVDQHAAAERITFEKLLRALDGEKSESQQYLVPVFVPLSKSELDLFTVNSEFFSSLGIRFDLKEDGIVISGMPLVFGNSEPSQVVRSLFTDLDNDELDLKNNYDMARENIVATMACHTSIRTNQALSQIECKSIVEQLLKCNNPYSCPHGRPIIWKQALSEIDSHFDRTY